MIRDGGNYIEGVEVERVSKKISQRLHCEGASLFWSVGRTVGVQMFGYSLVYCLAMACQLAGAVGIGLFIQ